VTSSCGAGKRDKEVWRRRGMRDFSRSFLLSFKLKSFQLSGIFRKPITAPIMQYGELKALKPHQVESSTAVQSSKLAE